MAISIGFIIIAVIVKTVVSAFSRLSELGKMMFGIWR